MDWYLDVIKNNYANFNGRARRKEYWMFNLINAVIIIALYLIMINSIKNYDGKSSNLGFIAIILLAIYVIATFIPSLAVTVRRLHDIDKSGWWCLISFIPFGDIVLFILTCFDSTKGNNKFGPNPKE